MPLLRNVKTFFIGAPSHGVHATKTGTAVTNCCGALTTIQSVISSQASANENHNKGKVSLGTLSWVQSALGRFATLGEEILGGLS